jgi:hypothetical protein
MAVNPIFTVRSLDGSRIGTYQAATAKQAISRAIREQAQYLSTFRRCGGVVLTERTLTAKVEPSPFN